MDRDSISRSGWQVATMGASLMRQGFAPCMLVGGKPLSDDRVQFAIVCLPEMTQKMLRDLLEELGEQSAHGHIELARIDYVNDWEEEGP